MKKYILKYFAQSALTKNIGDLQKTKAAAFQMQMILQIENVYPAGVMFNSYLRDKFPTLLLKMSEAGKRNNRAYSMFTYIFKKC